VNFINGYVVYPNPVTTGKVYILSSFNCTGATLFDVSGRLIKSYKLSGTENSLSLRDIAKGIYQLKIYSEGGVHLEKILVR